MADTDTHTDVRRTGPQVTSGETALRAVATARDRVAEARRSRSAGLIAGAERDLQAAVDQAREFDVPWGQIGLTLGIARGNAYQRYRRKQSGHGFTGGNQRLSKSA